MTARDIADALASRHWDYARHTVIPNCCQLGQEADLLVLHKSGWLDEVEIKISKHDFRREFSTKADKHERLVRGTPRRYLSQEKPWNWLCDWTEPKPTTVRRFWFAMPHELAAELLPEIPTHAGLLSVKPAPRGPVVSVLRAAPTLKPARKLTPDEIVSLLRSTYYRYWKLRRASREDV